MDKPIDILAAVTDGGGTKRVPLDEDSVAGKVIKHGLKLARDAKRMIMAKAEAKHDSVAHQCTAAMVAAIIQYRSEEHAAMLSPADSAPRRVWESMNALLVRENLGFATKEEADALNDDDE